MVPQISGRVVNSLDDITVHEVPTDGAMALFPSADGKCIYSKRWTPDGNISTMRFVPEASEAQPKQPSQLDIIDNRISELFDAVERIGNAVAVRRRDETLFHDTQEGGEGKCSRIISWVSPSI